MVDSFLIVMPELIVTGASLILMLIAAWVGDRSGPALTWLGVLALAVAAFFVPGIRDSGGVAFDGLFIGDSFAAFSKIVIYIGAAVSMVVQPRQATQHRRYKRQSPQGGCLNQQSQLDEWNAQNSKNVHRKLSSG